MTSTEKRVAEREALRSVIQQWNANRLDLFELSEPDENLQFHGVMRFYFQDRGQKVATKCIRVASDATVTDVIETLIEKFRPDMRMLSVPSYALYEVHSNGEERKLNADEKPLLVQLNWHIDDREGRFLLRNTDQKGASIVDSTDLNFKRKLSKREKKEQKKKEKLAKMNSNPGSGSAENNHVAEKLYTELPETSFTRSISNPEAVMRRRRQQILEKKLQQFRSKDGGPDTGGTLKIYGESLCRDVPYKTLLLSIRDCAQAVVREMLSKYGLDKADPLHYCLVQVNSDGTEYILDDDECPLSILMNHPTSRGSIMFHVRRRPADSQPRRRKKKPLGVSNGGNHITPDREGPVLVEITHSGEGGRHVKLTAEPIEVGSANTNQLQLFGPSIQPRHCLISLLEGVCTVTPLHADALTFVNGHHIQQPTILHNGSVVMFGRVASYKFVDSPSDGRYNLVLSQSQLDSACLYESRSPTSPSWHDDEPSTIGKESSDDPNKSVSTARALAAMATDDLQKSQELGKEQSQQLSMPMNDYDPDNKSETETKSLSSVKSNGSNPDLRSKKAAMEMSGAGQEAILPAVLEFPETHQESFLHQIIVDLDVNMPNFKLAPVYTLYLCARYRASTHYRPDLQPTERAHKLTVFLHHVANLISGVVQERNQDPRVLSFWMANSSEFYNFLKWDRHISAFSVQAQEVLTESVQIAFNNLVNCFRIELSQTLNQFLSENIDHESAAGLVLTVLSSAMALLRRSRVNAALTIQLFSQLFHYINAICFNTVVTNQQMCIETWGKVIRERLDILESWAHKQGLELAAECHLAKINQCADFLQATKTSEEDVQKLACSCFRLNSLQMAALLSQEKIPRNLIDTAIRMAESVADELTRGDDREVLLEESLELPLALLIPEDGFSSDVVRGIPAGLVDFLSPLQAAGMCRLAAQPTSIGLWTVYMQQYNQTRSSSVMSTKLQQPEVQVIKLHKNANGMGLSIVAAKGAGQERLGIYIKSVVPGGAADADDRLEAGDQLLKVDGQSLIGITQERAADYLVRTGPVVILEVAKKGAIHHGLAMLLQQPSPIIQRDNRRMSERDPKSMMAHAHQLPNSKSVPALHHVGNSGIVNNKSRSIHNLTGSTDQSFYQNLSVYRAQNQSQPNLGDRSQIPSQSTIISTTNSTTTPSNQQLLSRPASAYFNTNNKSNNTLPSQMSGHYVLPSNNNIAGNNLLSNQSHTMNNRPMNAFVRDTQNQQSLRMNPMMAPSMPNIAHSSGYSTNMTASQSMQNVNMIHPNYYVQPMQQQQQQQQQQQSNPNQMMNATFSNGYNSDMPKIQENTQTLDMAELARRRQQRQQDMVPMYALDVNVHNSQNSMPNLSSGSMLLSPGANPNDMMNNFRANATLTKGHSSQSGINYMPKQLPPTAPKPQMNRPQHHKDDLSPPLPPSATHPLFKTANDQSRITSSPNMSYQSAYYPSSQVLPKSFIGTTTMSPWEREEREKENEMRREQARQWREHHIIELSNLPHRTPQQEEQLKTIILERDFERLAQEQGDLEEDNDTNYGKDNMQEVIRLAQNSNQLSTPVTNMKQVDVKTNIVPQPSYVSTNANNDSMQGLNDGLLQQHPQSSMSQTHSAHVQPKSILKHNNARVERTSNSNPSSPSKQAKSTTFADDRQNADASVTSVVRDLNSMSFNESTTSTSSYQIKEMSEMSIDSLNNTLHGPPPPPERNSSYVVMSQKQQSLRNNNLTTTITNQSVKKTTTSSSSSTLGNEQPSAFGQFMISNKKTIANNTNNNNSNNTTNNVHNDSLNNNNDSNNNSTNNGNISISGVNNSSNTNANHSVLSSNNLASPMQTTVTNASLASMMAARDNKRVSFHDEENNLIMGQTSGDQADLSILREDPNRFIQETSAMLQTPTTPEGESWNTTVQQTPGVIGAQEVYRDPRTRRLQEKQQQQQQKSGDGVPEKLSFKEKMKMFALESGENQTPKDKLKISRAQRDIDAVH
ncbi:afadin isoform X3 [Sitodiplosis mosellana]|nr:afadin isoform X3 [Sitodiplosis mosellana]XP_055322106.1 afadin isoform X3 [Sitodiplosis mosellana]